MSILARVRGRVEEKSLDGVLVFANGLGFEIQVPLSTLTQMPEVGEEVTLRTYLHLREGSLGLFGFLTAEEQRMFELLLTVTGVGPKSAMSCLSLFDVEQLSAAIASGDGERLRRVPGVGRRTADRILLELRDRLGKVTPGSGVPPISVQDEVLEALMFYGYSATEASAAMATIPRDREMSTEEQTLWALQYFAPQAEGRTRSR